MNDLTTSYFSIEKSDKQPDGTLMVYGKATDDSVDIDQQICDAGWLDRAMPAWFKSGGNIREQHSSIAAGVAKEYEPKADGHYIMAHIVDPVSVKKVDAGVLRGFSIGIKGPRVVRDTKAANGRIIDGQIVEVSLVDRPANPNCQLVLAKSVDGESSLVQVEELSEIEKHGTHNQKTHGGRGGAGGGAGNKTNTSVKNVQRGDAFEAELKSGANIRGIAQAKATPTMNLKTGQTEMGVKYKPDISDPKTQPRVLFDSEIKTVTILDVDKSTDADLEKHGSHNQKTHGARGGAGVGGGAGGGESGSTGENKDKPASVRDNKKVTSIGDDASAIGSEIDEIIESHESEDTSLILSNSDLNRAMRANQNIDKALTRIDAATGVKSDAQHYSALSEASDYLDEASTELSNAGKRSLQILGRDLMDNVDDLDEYLTGLSDAAISGKSLVKHGSHNQSSHGRRGSGGGAGGGASGSSASKVPSARVDRSEQSLSTTQSKLIDTHAAEARGLADDAQRLAKQDSAVRPAARNLTSAAEHLNNASGAKTIGEAKSGIRRAKVSIDRAVTNLEDQNYNTEASHAYAFSKELNSFMTGLGNGVIKATDAELRKALQSALQLHSLNKSEETSMKDTLVELPVEVVADLLKFDAAQYEAARNALASLIEVEAGEMRDGHNEIQSISHLLQSVMHLHAWYEGEEAEGEVVEKEEMIEEDKYMAAEAKEEEAEKSAEVSKCLECGCNQPGQSHGSADVTTAEMYSPDETPKSAEGEEPAVAAEEEVKAEEPTTEETPAVETTEVSADDKPADVEALVEQVVKSATESLKSEIADLVSAKEAALNKAMSLETELELAKSLAVAGGPSRTAKPINVKTTNDLLTKAAIYKAKANATTDPTLAKGYKTLAEEFLSKASEADNK